MSGAILTLLDQPAAAPGLLRAASRLAELAGGAVVHALIVRTPPAATIMPSEEVLTTGHAAEIRAAEHARAADLAAAFAAWRPQVPHGAELDDVEALVPDVVAQRGAAADFIVAARPSNHPPGPDLPAIRAALFSTDRPVLLVPPGDAGEFGRSVAVAWRDDGHVVKAVLPALRLLSSASYVHVLQGVRDGPAPPTVPPVFREHEVAAQMHVLPIGAGVFGQVLLDAAHRLGADLLVMGAYGHNPLRELIFGGVTRFMLEHADLPVLMRH
ncbi:MAG TPA: universal stress protein [Acetobacteraceae bacterium]|nr:universal stress protein [Acetobacteraceae bacterium]